MLDSMNLYKNILIAHKNAYFSNIVFRCFSRRKTFKNCDNYVVLGVNSSATKKEIKIAYYDKSKQYHPDLNDSEDAAIKFQELNVAYEILSNDEARKEYDISRGIIPKHAEIGNIHNSSRPEFYETDQKPIKLTRRSFNHLKRDVYAYHMKNSNKDMTGSCDFVNNNYNVNQDYISEFDREVIKKVEASYAKHFLLWSSIFLLFLLSMTIFEFIAQKIKVEFNVNESPKNDN